jgi:hypothetical protein
MMPLRASVFLLVTMTGLVTARPAAAFVRTTTDKMVSVKWARPCVNLVAHVADPPPNLTPDLVTNAARAAAAAWGHDMLSCSGFDLQVTPSDTPDTAVANDQMNNLVFRKTWPAEYDLAALAITTVFAVQTTGAILDADVELNAVRFKWGDLVAGVGLEGGAEDLQNTLTHEFGHLLGLDHNCFLSGNTHHAVDNAGVLVPDCNRASPEAQDATMFASVTKGDTLRRTLAPDDIAGVCAIYPASSTAGTCTPGPGPDATLGGGGCSYGGAPAGSVAALLLAAGLGITVRRRRVQPRG